MRIKLAVVAACIVVAACDDPSKSNGDAASSAPASPLEAALRGCSNAQGTVYDALQTSDTGFALSSLGAAQAACRGAATELRRTPLPNLDQVRGPAAIDEMADGLGQVEDAVRIMNTSPARARRRAQRGMHLYQAGLAALTAARS